jgi:uncharacterized protein
MAASTGRTEPRHPDTGSKRTCAVTRQVVAPSELLRFVVGPDGSVVPDLARKLPGRGVWLTCSKDIVATAVKTGAFSRSVRMRAAAPPDLAEQVERAILKRVAQALSLANKAGQVVFGFSRVEAAIGEGLVEALIHASDAAPDGVEKLDRQYKAMARESGRKPLILRALTVEQLALALGRANVVHAALNKGGAAANFIAEVQRLNAYRAGGAEKSGARPPGERAPSREQD